MPDISPTTNRTIEGIPYLRWANVATTDTEVAHPVMTRLGGAVSFTGTFGGATVKLQQSNDNVTFFDMKDVYGTVISATADALFIFRTDAAYIRPLVSGGTSDAVNIIVTMRSPVGVA